MMDGLPLAGLLGKTGEARSNRAVQLTVKHRDFREPVKVALRSDRDGLVQLGTLTDISYISATTPDGTARQWTLPEYRNAYLNTISGAAGEDVVLPYSGTLKKADRSGAHCALVVGEAELASGSVGVKVLREEVAQQDLSEDALVAFLRRQVVTRGAGVC